MSDIIDQAQCKHASFAADVAVARIEDVGRFRAEVKIKCADCGHSFQFLSLPPGYSANGAHVSIDGLCADLPIAPAGTTQSPLQAMMRGMQTIN